MLLNIVRVVYAFVCAGAIVAYLFPASEGIERPYLVEKHPFLLAVVLMLLTQAVTVVDVLVRRKRVEVVSAIYFGLLIGMLLSFVLIQALSLVITEDAAGRDVIVLLITLTLPYLCISLLLQTKDDFRFIIPYVEFARELKGGKPLVLDSSALIDGRIADMLDTHILDSEIVVPQFVLHEVQDIADSNDKNRRTRGRRGLEVLSKLQNSPNAEIRVHETKNEDYGGMTVDQRLIEVSKQLGGRIVTNDFNLNKVASLQGIPVINLNDVANSLKPRYIPGERLKIKVLKEGESPGQGIGYLDDGTMVVCEQAQHLIGREIDCIVTSVLQ
ncbi:MAG: PIN/TRAM domain-containing protein, partial [Planctomycetaceae bacterium]